jgi:hypothetical protein
LFMPWYACGRPDVIRGRSHCALLVILALQPDRFSCGWQPDSGHCRPAASGNNTRAQVTNFEGSAGSSGRVVGLGPQRRLRNPVTTGSLIWDLGSGTKIVEITMATSGSNGLRLTSCSRRKSPDLSRLAALPIWATVQDSPDHLPVCVGCSISARYSGKAQTRLRTGRCWSPGSTSPGRLRPHSDNATHLGY